MTMEFRTRRSPVATVMPASLVSLILLTTDSKGEVGRPSLLQSWHWHRDTDGS